jgi:predicted ribosome quality control (RQC) complex YloA/Tae2 family protein
MYKKLKKMERSMELGSLHLAKIKSEYLALTNTIATLSETAPDSNTLEAIYKRFQIPVEAQKKKLALENTVSKPYHEFPRKDGTLFLVGKSALENDILCKKAKGNDYWFHVVSGTGSHVILPAKTLKHKALSPSLIREGAILAIHYSKLRASQAGEVQFTLRSYLKKPKGAPPGMWVVERAETLFIRYEIDELKQILGSGDKA